MSRKIWRSVKAGAKKHRKEFIVDTAFTTIFWLIVHAFKDVLIVRMDWWQVAVAAASGAVLNLLLSGVYGQCLNWVRRKLHVG